MFCSSALLGVKLLCVEVRMLSFPAVIMGKGFISPEGSLCGASTRSSEITLEFLLESIAQA